VLGKKRKSAFTLVELLVVVAIIVLLLAMLTPALQRAKELTRRVICGSQGHQWQIAATLYARSYKNSFPVANPDSDQWSPVHNATISLSGIGIDSMYIVSWKLGVGLGLLLDKGYITDGRMADCPSSTHPYMRYDKLDTAYGNYGYGGWPAPGKAGPAGHRECSYQYRATIGSPYRPVRIDQDPPGTAFMADFWVYHIYHSEGGILGLGTFMHRTGYVTTYLDGHSQFLDDPTESLINASHHWANWPLQEGIWQSWFDRR